MSPSGWTVSNFQTKIIFSAVKRRLTVGSEAEELGRRHSFSSTERQKAIGGVQFRNESTTLQPRLEVDDFKPRFQRSIFEGIFLA
jgi:hypothetical protein